jgi:hypothetical protein
LAREANSYRHVSRGRAAGDASAASSGHQPIAAGHRVIL